MPDEDVPELPASEQPPTDDPWVIVTPMPRPPKPEAALEPPRPRRRRGTLCPVCGAYFACEHD